MTQYGFYFDSSRCTGCRTCTMACKDYNDLPTDIAFRTVYDYEGGDWSSAGDDTFKPNVFAYHVSVACNHCAMPACAAKCPQGAIAKNMENGLVERDLEKCIGCGTCAKTCPYGAPKIDAEEAKSVKCDACASRVAEGKNPVCVDACPLRALEFGDIEELRAAHPGCVDAVAPLPSGEETTPSLAIKACPAAKDAGDTTGFVANELEVTAE